MLVVVAVDVLDACRSHQAQKHRLPNTFFLVLALGLQGARLPSDQHVMLGASGFPQHLRNQFVNETHACFP